MHGCVWCIYHMFMNNKWMYMFKMYWLYLMVIFVVFQVEEFCYSKHGKQAAQKEKINEKTVTWKTYGVWYACFHYYMKKHLIPLYLITTNGFGMAFACNKFNILSCTSSPNKSMLSFLLYITLISSSRK